ncbi:MAG TPA: CHAP domain-containing protein [Nitrososphaera sp.]|nr:CHAP domain-containing protein [Nitrososphaera sp.]
MLITSVLTPTASAAKFDQQINNLKQNSAQAEQKKQQLGTEAVSLSGTIAALQAEISALESQIKTTRSKVNGLKQDIAKAEAELAHQRNLLGLNVREMYTDQDITTLEMLASSQNFSHFVDREQYRNSLQEKIDAATDRIEKLMAELDQEKQSVERLLSDQQAMQDNVSARRAENARLLSLNVGQQQAFQNEMNINSARAAELQRQQASENRKGFISRPNQSALNAKPAPKPVNNGPKAAHGTSYPWASVPFPNSMPDPWGMYKRQCVSYTAWKVASSGRHMPYWGGRGNAKLWDDNARRAGSPVDNNPRVGDVAVSNRGAYGHVMYVEAVHGDGTITISQYNAGLDGRYSEGRRSTAGLTFVHF